MTQRIGYLMHVVKIPDNLYAKIEGITTKAIKEMNVEVLESILNTSYMAMEVKSKVEIMLNFKVSAVLPAPISAEQSFRKIFRQSC